MEEKHVNSIGGAVAIPVRVTLVGKVVTAAMVAFIKYLLCIGSVLGTSRAPELTCIAIPQGSIRVPPRALRSPKITVNLRQSCAALGLYGRLGSMRRAENGPVLDSSAKLQEPTATSPAPPWGGSVRVWRFETRKALTGD